ncbi:MAG: hypothetical protein HOP00_01225 [Nitrospira sp.]|nr:hypothetical protein [Nitrospira sp.]
MSGIAGVVLTDRRARIEVSVLSSMVRALSLGQEGVEKILDLQSVGLVAQGPNFLNVGVAEMPALEHQCGLAFCGSLYDTQWLFSEQDRTGRFCKDLLQLYMETGIGMLKRLRGEFVIAVWDGRDDTLYLAVDRFRVHPLFYYEDTDSLVFGSRIGSVRCALSRKALSVNPEAIMDVMAHSAVPTPRSIFREIKKIPPGSILTRRNGESKLASYWDADFLKPDSTDEAALSVELKRHFSDAVMCRVNYDKGQREIGTFLSGGIDSSTVTGVLSRIIPSRVRSFSIGFQEQRFNELEFARIAARHFGAEIFEYQVGPKDTVDAIPTILNSFDEPFANASAIPTYYCAKVAKDHGVAVLYAGDGGDELFAGNERYSEQRIFDYYGCIPRGLRTYGLEPTINVLAHATGLRPFVKAQKYVRRANIPYPQRLSSYGLFNVIQASDLFDPEMLRRVGLSRDPYEVISRHYYNAPASNELDRQMYIDWKLTLADIDIFKVARMTEAAGIGVRFPFLDHRLAEFSTSVPASIRMRGLKLRSFFKGTYADFLPAEVLNKTKHGFGLPISVWLKTYRPLNEMMHDLVLSSTSLQRGYFRRSMIEKIVHLHESDQTSFYGTVLWNLMVLELWHRANLEPLWEKG